MGTKMDDLEAVRSIVDTLSKFDENDRNRILRWVCEKMGTTLAIQPSPGQVPPTASPSASIETPSALNPSPSFNSSSTDIRSFVDSKNPSSDMQFAAVVAYYYAFEAPEAERKLSIGSEDLQDACRKTGRRRLARPGQTLVNAAYNGLLDKAEDKGTYKINTVGENLVAVTLPDSGSKPKTASKAKRKPKTTKSNKNPRKKKSSKRKTQARKS